MAFCGCYVVSTNIVIYVLLLDSVSIPSTSINDIHAYFARAIISNVITTTKTVNNYAYDDY